MTPVVHVLVLINIDSNMHGDEINKDGDEIKSSLVCLFLLSDKHNSIYLAY